MVETSKIEELLAGLGTNREEVMESLKKEGIKGEKGNGCRCPVARYLCKKLGIELGLLSVGSGDVLYGDPVVTCREPVARVPSPISYFIFAFDEGHYPDLVEG